MPLGYYIYLLPTLSTLQFTALALKHNHTLRELDLEGCNIGPEGASSLGKHSAVILLLVTSC